VRSVDWSYMRGRIDSGCRFFNCLAIDEESRKEALGLGLGYLRMGHPNGGN